MVGKLLPASLLALASLMSGTAAVRADTVVVTADRMIDVLTGRTVLHPQITITDGRITAVGGAAAPGGGAGAFPAPARRVNLRGATLPPGFIEMHPPPPGDPRYRG